MKLSYFKEFIVLAETANFWEAAERLYLNQSTLSKHIRAMEEQLGVPLFNRTSRRVELTDYAVTLLPYAKTIVKAQFDYATALLQRQQFHANTLTIGCIPSMVQHGITGLLVDFEKAYPQIRLKVVEDDTYGLWKKLEDQQCQLALCRAGKPSLAGFSQPQNLQSIPYCEDQLVAILPPGHPLQQRRSVSLRELSADRFAFVKDGSFLYDLCRGACQEADFVPEVIFDSHRLDSIQDMAAKLRCTALVMGCHAAPPEGCTVAQITPPITSQVQLCYRSDCPMPDTVRTFLDFMTSRT